jgi:hypothetical protein
MLFSNRYKFLFVHIAKTAGTSIQSALKRLRRRDPLSCPQVLCYNFSKSRAGYREYYDEELSELVENHYRRDIEAFGYSFDGKLPSGSLQGEVSAKFRRSVSSDLVTEL